MCVLCSCSGFSLLFPRLYVRIPSIITLKSVKDAEMSLTGFLGKTLHQQIAFFSVYSQLVLVTRTLAGVQFTNETHQFSSGNGPSDFESCVCLIYACVLQLTLSGLYCLLPDGLLVEKAFGKTQTHSKHRVAPYLK